MPVLQQSNGFAKQQLPLNHFPLKEQKDYLALLQRFLEYLTQWTPQKIMLSQHNMHARVGKSEGVTYAQNTDNWVELSSVQVFENRPGDVNLHFLVVG